jgi:FeS assembly SUF system protein
MANRPVNFVRNPDQPDSLQPLDADAPLEQRIIALLRTIYDPELPVNIYDLGLIYDIQIDDDNNVAIKMTLTAPACPVAGSMPGQVERTIATLNDAGNVSVELVWDPPWDKDRMSDEAKLALNMY